MRIAGALLMGFGVLLATALIIAAIWVRHAAGPAVLLILGAATALAVSGVTLGVALIAMRRRAPEI